MYVEPPDRLLAAHDALRVLHRDAALALFHEHDREDDRDTEHQEEVEARLPRLVQDRQPLGGQPRDHAGEDQDRHPVPDPALRDQLTEPHDHGGAGREREHDDRDVLRVEDLHDLELVVEQEHEAGRLQQRQRDRHVTRPLRDLLDADLALTLPLLEPRDHDGQQLHDDRAGDVRHDPQREHGEPRQRAAGEQVDELQDALSAVRRLVELLLELVEVDVRGRQVRAEAEHRDDEQREEDLLSKVRDFEGVDEGPEHQMPLSRGEQSSGSPPTARCLRPLRSWPWRRPRPHGRGPSARDPGRRGRAP